MTLMITGPSVLLRQLRSTMAEALDPQVRLDTIVSDIASVMEAEVCSLYVLRADRVLELYATYGLRLESVHVSSLAMGQGLVGTIADTARGLNLKEAPQHPSFEYLKETGEEIFSSFLGVPILRAGRVLGVVVVQNKKPRIYSDAEVEVLETTAMVLGELIATGELDALSAKSVSLDLSRPLQVNGVALSDGIGAGKVVLHEPRSVVATLFNEDAKAEITRLRQALSKVRMSIDVLFRNSQVPLEGEHRDVLEAYRMFANDQGWSRRMEEAVHAGFTAEAAVEKVQNDNRARMMRIPDPYLRERAKDFDDLANRLLRELAGGASSMAPSGQDGNFIVVAKSMGAAELLDYHSEKLRGVVLEDASPTSHVVIVARAMGIPIVGQLSGFVSNAEEKDLVIVDAIDGVVYLRPPSDVMESYDEKVKFRASQQKEFLKMRHLPSVTSDGQAVQLLMNAGLVTDIAQLDQSGAEGIGLFRTELQFMVSATFPRVGEQEELYRQVLHDAGEVPVVFRTLDIGGDKVLPYLEFAPEENPALGWRAIRLGMDRPALMRSQIRALLKASANQCLKLMTPLVTEVKELRQVRRLIDKEVALQNKFGNALPKTIELGCMIEVPSLMYQLDELMAEADFVSVGSNDLYQFTMACDRGNPRLSNRYTPISRPFLRMLRQIVVKANENDIPLTLCGEMASRPLSAMAVLAIGYRAISMSPAAIGPIKAMVRSLDLKKLEAEFLSVLESQENEISIQEFLSDFADRNGIMF